MYILDFSISRKKLLSSPSSTKKGENWDEPQLVLQMKDWENERLRKLVSINKAGNWRIVRGIYYSST